MNYGLGSDNQNLPGFVVMTELALLKAATNWSNGFLSPRYQGTRLRSVDLPSWIWSHLNTRTETTSVAIDELTWLNEQRDQEAPPDECLAARVANYELAFQMQAEVPSVVDLSRESEATQRMYGLDEPDTDAFGRQCLMVRRLVESGVRFVQIFSGGWDSHDYLERGHPLGFGVSISRSPD
ncbi:MAG: DUF1501 domain-containing protein [Pirellulaceae bacterium]